jgi:hypothetical protein
MKSITACGGYLIDFILNRNKRSAQWEVAPIEVADNDFQPPVAEILSVLLSTEKE